MKVLTKMDPLSCDNAIYEDIKVKSSHGGFNIHENECYGKFTSKVIQKHEEKNHSYSKVIIMAFVIVFALLLGTAGACVAFALQITTLKSEMASLKMASSITLEEVHRLNTSIDMQLSQQNASIDSAYQQLNEQLNTSIDMRLSQQNAPIDSAYQQLNEQLNTSIDMLYKQLSQQNASTIDILYQQLSQQNASIDSAYQQLNERLFQQLNTSVNMLYQQMRNQNASIDSAYQLLQKLSQQLNTSINMLYQQINPASSSCKDLYDTSAASSGYYWIGEVGSAVRVYCNMSLTCGGVTGGWMRVANIDMTNTSQNCPSGLTLISSPKRVCDITSNGCVSTEFDVHGVQYSHVCGRVIAYQNRVPIAFHFQSRGIDADYVYGVSLTHGQNPREHIWTFAGASDESTGYSDSFKCPCINTNINPPPTVPSFVGSEYFCDTALSVHYNTVPVALQAADPLWDGEGCGSTNTCCHDPQREVNPPWFVKTLSSPTSDNIEMRMCRPDSSGTTPFEIVEFYVQ